MKKICLLTIIIWISAIGFAQKPKSQDNTLSPQEIGEGWKLLCDGKTTEGFVIAFNARMSWYPNKGDRSLGSDYIQGLFAKSN
jgi:hypothetical protein